MVGTPACLVCTELASSIGGQWPTVGRIAGQWLATVGESVGLVVGWDGNKGEPNRHHVRRWLALVLLGPILVLVVGGDVGHLQSLLVAGVAAVATEVAVLLGALKEGEALWAHRW